MNKKTVRTGIVGAGFSASFHFEALRKVYGTNVEVIGVHAKDQEPGKAYAQRRRIRFFESLDALLDEVDAIHVCVPPMAHEPVAVAGLRRDKFVICEKPLTGYFGDGTNDFHWERADMQVALDVALASLERMLTAERDSKGRLFYAENWVYAPAIQKEREILEKTGGQILWIHGEEAHSGSHSVDYAYAARCGGGVPHRQRLPSAHRGPLPETGRRPGAKRRADPAENRLGPDPRDHAAAPPSVTRATSVATTTTSTTSPPCTSSSTTARSSLAGAPAKIPSCGQCPRARSTRSFAP